MQKIYPSHIVQYKRILLVEDNPDDELLAKMALKRSIPDIVIDVARDGLEVLDYFFSENRALNALPNLIILDLNIPKINGLEVLKRLRIERRTQSIPIVVLTTSNEDNDIKISSRLGANSYIRKPVDFVLFSKITDLIGQYWFDVNETVHS